MLRRITVILNILVILTGFGFVLRGIYPAAGLSLLTGGLNILMLRATETPRVTFMPIVFNMFVFTMGNMGIFVGFSDLYGQTEGLSPARGYTLIALCPIFTLAGLITMIVFFKRLLHARRDEA